MLRHRNLLAGVESVTRAWRMTPEDRLVHCLPVFHAHGLVVGAYGTLPAGGSAVLLPASTPTPWPTPCATHVAIALLRGADHVPPAGRRRSGRRTCRPSACACPARRRCRPTLHAAVTAAVGSPVLERYGMTETLMNTSNPYDGERRAGTVGFPLPGVEVAFDDTGEVLLRGPNVFDGYFERDAANAEAFRDRGDGGGPWFATGDLGADDDGYLVLRGRSKELIISGGFNVYPTEVEDVLAGCPGVAEVAVTGTPSDEWGEVVTAWVVADGTAPSVDDLRAHCAGLLAPYKRPRLVRVVDALPRNALGKVVRSRLG